MIEIRERAIDPADQPPEIAQQLRRLTFQVSESDAGQPIDHPYDMPHPGRRPARAHKGAGFSWRYTLPPRRALGDARHRLLLRFKQRAVFQRVRYLENVLPAGSVLQQKVLITFAGQRGRRHVEAVKIAGERSRLFEAETWRIFEHRIYSVPAALAAP